MNSYENQVEHYTNRINAENGWTLEGIYADKGISGTSVKNCNEFNRMIRRCKQGKIDMIITKSIARFARNTVDCLKYVRLLNDLGVDVYFEEQGIHSNQPGAEFYITIYGSIAQSESENISANVKWGKAQAAKEGKVIFRYNNFLGYRKGDDGKPEIVPEEADIIRLIYDRFLVGDSLNGIAELLESKGVASPSGKDKWQLSTIQSILSNEKYKGDALLQKSYTVDFLTKKRTQNKGEIQMFYVEYDHDAIISKRIWECVQLEIKRRKKYLEEHGTNSYSHRPESNPFASKIICGDCNKVFARKGWRSSTGVDRKVWQCSERYKVKGVMGCANRHVEEKTLIKAYLMAWNVLVENREDFMEQWTEQLQSKNLLEGYRAEKFIEYTDGAEPLTEMDTDFMLKTLDHIKVFEDGTLLVVFLDGTETECKNEEE